MDNLNLLGKLKAPNRVDSMRWLGFLRRKAKAPLPAKDPMDWTLTASSGEWNTDQYCPQCKHSTTHREKMADICNHCGHLGGMMRYRSYRKIWNGEKWVCQMKYGNGPKDYELVEA